MASLLIGADGGTNATSGIVPEWTRELFDLTLAGRLDEARDVQLRVLKVFDMMLGAGDFPAGFRAGVAVRGFDVGSGRQPLTDSQTEQLEQLKQSLSSELSELVAS